MPRSSIWFALQQCRYQPPKTHDATAFAAYYGKVADKVLEQIAVRLADRAATDIAEKAAREMNRAGSY